MSIQITNTIVEVTYEWRSGNGELSGGTCTQNALDACLEAFKLELLYECSTDEDREDILNGVFIVSHPSESDREISVRDIDISAYDEETEEVQEGILSAACMVFHPDFDNMEAKDQ